MAAWNPVHRVGRQIEEALRGARPRPARRPGHRGAVLELLASVGLDEPERVAASYPHELSGGQLQRAMIAMATGREPELLIADEPTTALDVTVQAGHPRPAARPRRRGTAVLLITHDMGVVADLADDVAVMHDGRVVERARSRRCWAAPRGLHPDPSLGRADLPRGPEPGGRPESREVVRLDRWRPLRARCRRGARRPRRGPRPAGRDAGSGGGVRVGKSTSAARCTGLVRPTEGAPRSTAPTSRSPHRPPPHAVREVGIVFQDRAPR